MRWAILCLLWLALAACDARTPAASSTTTGSAATASATATTSSTQATPERDEAAGIGYLVRYTGGASSAETLPLVVAIHGLGDRPNRFGLLTGFPGKARVILPRGSIAHGKGFSWFDIRVRGQRDEAAIAAGVTSASDALSAMLQVLRTRFPTHGRAIVTGFSQGGMLSFALAVQHPELVAVALPVSGWLPDSLLVGAKPDGAPPIVALHGDADEVLPIQPTRDAVAKLRAAGYDAELLEYPGVGHGVSGQMRRELYRRLAAATLQ